LWAAPPDFPTDDAALVQQALAAASKNPAADMDIHMTNVIPSLASGAAKDIPTTPPPRTPVDEIQYDKMDKRKKSFISSMQEVVNLGKFNSRHKLYQKMLTTFTAEEATASEACVDKEQFRMKWTEQRTRSQLKAM
jgi:hypothetical protein